MAGFFGMFNYAKEGPGVAKNAPKKRSFFAFMEIYGRKFWKLAIAGLLWTITALPILTRGWADAGLTLITRNYSREKHAFIKEDFFETIKKNRKNALIIGIINTLVTGIFFFNMLLLIPKMIPGLYVVLGTILGNPPDKIPAPQDLSTMEMIILALTLIGYVTFTWMKYYIPFLMITFKLNIKQVYKNSFLFAAANMKVNLGVSAILIVIYVALLLSLYIFPNVMALAVIIMLCVSVLPAFRSFLIQYTIFPAIKRLIIDPYYEANPNADKQARLDLGLEVEESPAAESETTTEKVQEDQTEDKPAENEAIFTDTLPTKEDTVPKRVLPKQYNDQEMRRFNRQVRNRVDDDDDDTI